MQVAHAQVVSAGGKQFEDATLMTMFDNALPISYSVVRQHVRRANHKTFLSHFNDYLSLVKAENDAQAGDAPASQRLCCWIHPRPSAADRQGWRPWRCGRTDKQWTDRTTDGVGGAACTRKIS